MLLKIQWQMLCRKLSKKTALVVNIITVTFQDGTWQKRDHKSLNGAVTATTVDTGKVVDVCVVTKYCTCLDKQNNEENCTANYEGSVESITDILPLLI